MHYGINKVSDSNHAASKSCGSTTEGQNWVMLFGCALLSRVREGRMLPQGWGRSPCISLGLLKVNPYNPKTLLQWLPL